MAQTLTQRMMELGVPFVMANELVRQMNAGVYNFTRLINAGWVEDLARYLSTSLAAGTFKATKAVEYSMIPAVATLVAGGGVPWKPSDLGAQYRGLWISGQSASLPGISAVPTTEYILAVATLTTADTDRTLVGAALDGARSLRVNANETVTVLRRGRSVFAPSTGAVPVSGALPASGGIMVGLEYTVGATNGVKWWNYGNFLAQQTQATGWDADAAAATTVIGGPVDTFAGVNAVLLTAPLSTADRQKAEGYMAWKYGDPTKLDVAHPYYASPPKTSAFVMPPFDWWLSIGQSNGRGEGAGYSAGTDAVPTYGVFQYDRTTDAIIAAINPMRDYDPIAARTGHTYGFAKGWKQKGKNCVILPYCEGSTALVGGVWAAPSGSRYLAALNSAAAFAAAYPQGRFCGFLWDQGEQDAFSGVTKAAYETAAVAMFSGFRAGISGAANKPILVTGLAPQWISGGAAAAQVIDNALRNLPNLITNCTYVDPVGLTSNDTGGDVIHFDAASQRTLATRNLAAASIYYPEVA